MPPAAIAFDFDPLLRLTGDLAVRWQTLALAALLFAILVAVGVRARGLGLRPDDALAIAVGAVPGAVIGGRLGYLLLRPEAFAGGPASLVDPAVGGLELVSGVAGGMVTAAYVAALLGTSVASWARLAALPLLVLLGGGKLAMALGGSGQGLPSDAAWATAYLGTGPWGSLAPDLPSHPAQLYEGAATLVLGAVLAITTASLDARRATAIRRPRPDGRLLLVGLAGWALIRATASTTWRDPVALGPLPTGGWVALVFALAAIAAVAALTARQQRALDASAEGPPGPADPSWPDPAARPPF